MIEIDEFIVPITRNVRPSDRLRQEWIDEAVPSLPPSGLRRQRFERYQVVSKRVSI